MADTSLAMRSHGAVPTVGNQTSVARAAGAASARASDPSAFARSFGAASQASQATPTAPVGSGLLSTGVQLLLAETRTQEAAAAYANPSNLERARDAYQRVQKRVRETINASILASAPEPALQASYASSGRAAYAAAAATYEDSGALEDDIANG